MEIETGIEEAIRKVESQEALATILGCTQQVISAWKAQGYVPVGRVVEVENATGVPRSRLINPRIVDLLDTTNI